MGWFSSLVGGVVGFLVGGPVGAVIGAGIGATSVGEKIVNTVVDFVVQPFMGIFGVPSIPNQAETQRQQGVLITQRGGGVTNIPVVYGLRKVGGVITYAETGPASGTPANRYLWVIYVLSEGPVEGLYELYINDDQIDGKYISSLNSGTKTVITDGKYANRVVMQYSKGQYYSTPSASPVGGVLKGDLFSECPGFKNTMVYNGLSILAVRYEWLAVSTQAEADANPFSGNIPDIGAVILGRTVASLVTSASESYEYGASGYSERYSTNPAEILLDYLRNPRYGKGMKNREIDWDSWRIAAAKCNTEVTYTTTNIAGPIMTCNYVLDTGYTIFQNVKILLQGFRAYMPYVQGRYKLKIEDAGNPTDITSGSATIIAECVATSQIIDASLLDNTYEIMGDVVYTGIDRSNKYNQVVVTYVDPRVEYKWATQQIVYPETEEERLYYVALDGGRENKLEITLPTLTNYAIARDFAKILFNKSRYAETATLRVSSHAFELEPGDNIRIQSRILNFGDVPWRVVAIQANEDYTFDLGCVRNPDFLYPYTRIGEPDRVLPIYVPKGATIYYPKELDRPDLSLIPPTSSTGGGGTIGNPGATDPTTSTGGGVGGNTGSVNTNQTNDTPPTAPKPQPLTDAIDVLTVKYIDKNGLRYGTITFKQPAHAMYQGVNFYWRLTGSTGSFQNMEDRQRPGSGSTITLDIGPLAVISSLQSAFNRYTVYARVVYSTGEYSTKYITFELDPTAAVGTTATVSETVITITSSTNTWPTIKLVDSTRRDNAIDTVSAEIIAPVPQTSTRSMTLRITQDSRNEGPNYDVTGFNVYYKLSSATYWKKASHTFPAGYAPGTVVSTPFTGSIGTTGQPAIYTVAIRLTYRDGTESSRQYVASFEVESAGYASPSINLLYGIAVRSVSGITKTGVMNVGDLVLVTEDLAPPGAVVNPLNMTIGVDTVITTGTVTTQSGLGLVLYPPDASNRANWQGIRVYYRPVIAGQNPALSKQDFTSATDITITNNTTNTYKITGIKHDTYYEMVIVPLVLSGNTNFVESNNCVMGVGYVTLNRSDPLYPGIFTVNGDGNWVNNWKFQQMQTLTALNKAGQIFSGANPYVNVTGVFGVNKYNPYEFDPNYGMKQRIGEFIELTFDNTGITNYESLYIYRRDYYGNSGATVGTNCRHWGAGRWERVVIVGGSGPQTVNLRLPASYEQFNRFYEVPGATAYGTGMYTSYTSTGRPADIYPIANTPRYVQLLLVVKQTTGLSTQGVLIKMRVFDTGVVRTNMLMNGTFPVKPEIITYSTYATIQDSDFTAGYDRRLADARLVDIAQYNRYYRGAWSTTDSLGNPRATYGYDLIAGYPAVDAGSAIV